MANLFGNNSNNILTGTASTDNLFGQSGNDQMSGLAGNDRLNGGVGNDRLDGGTGIDTADYSSGVLGGQSFTGATAGVTVNLNLTGAQATGGAGSDTLVSIENLIGTTFTDVLSGNSANNVLLGLAGNDQIFGNAGSDVLNGGLGNDLLNGGSGGDTADYNNFRIGGTTYIGATAGVTVNLNLTSAQNTRGAGLDTLVAIEHLNGTDFNDTFIGNSLNNTLAGLAGNDALTGNDGNDTLIGWGGNDTLSGGSGNDLLNGGSGNDWLDGGPGIDTVTYITATAGVRVDLTGDGQTTGGAGSDTLVSIENLIGTNFNDTFIIDGTENSTFSGGNGNDYIEVNHYGLDTLNGDAGNDTLLGGNGFGTLNGGTGNDRLIAYDGAVLNGGDGDDLMQAVGGVDRSILNGGAGADSLQGSGGASGGDTYDYNVVSDSPAGAGRDTIITFAGFGVDFGDQIDLRDLDANSLLSSNQAFTYIGSAAFTAAGQLRYNPTTGVLQGSTDGDTAAEIEIQLVGAPTLVVGGTGTDILL